MKLFYCDDCGAVYAFNPSATGYGVVPVSNKTCLLCRSGKVVLPLVIEEDRDPDK